MRVHTLASPLRCLAFAAALTLAACGNDGGSSSATATADTSGADASDTAGADATTDDSASDATGDDSAVADTGAADTGVEDSAVEDTAAEDTAAEDTAAVDTAVEDTAAADTGAEDTSSADTAVEDTAAADTGAEDTGAADTADADAADPGVFPEGNLVSAGYSTAKCVGACKTELVLEGASLELTISDNKGDPLQMGKGVLTTGAAAQLEALINAIGATPLEATYGCPGCTDGPIAWLTFSNGKETFKHTYEFKNAPAVLAGVDKLANDAISALGDCKTNEVVVTIGKCPMDLP